MWWLRLNNECTLSFKSYKEAVYHANKEMVNNPNKKITIEIFKNYDTGHS